MQYQRAGRSGLKLPALSLGLWQTSALIATPRRRAHCCSARSSASRFIWPATMARRERINRKSIGEVLISDLAAHRDELIISSRPVI
jgi:L-glyceraldehyde 3-phosphate reductase